MTWKTGTFRDKSIQEMEFFSKYIFYEITQILSLKDTIKLSGVCKRNHRIIRAKYGDKYIFLIKDDIDNQVDRQGNTLLMIALVKCNIRAIKVIVQAGANIILTHDKYGDTAILMALRRKNQEIIKYLVDASKPNDIINCEYNDNYRHYYGSPFIEAFKENDYKYVKFLLDIGLNPNIHINEDTPLIIAARNRYGKMVKLLLNKGAKINKQNCTGRTALMEASVMNDPKLVKYLLKKGADKSIEDINGKTAHRFAEILNNRKITYILKMSE